MNTAFILLWLAVAPNGVTLTSGSARFDSERACESAREAFSSDYLAIMLSAPKNEAGKRAWEARCVPAR